MLDPGNASEPPRDPGPLAGAVRHSIQADPALLNQVGRNDPALAEGRRNVEETLSLALAQALQQFLGAGPRGAGCVILLVFLLVCLPVAAFGLYCMAWWVLCNYWLEVDLPCDVPLGNWLALHLCYTLSVHWLRQTCIKYCCCWDEAGGIPLRAKVLQQVLQQWIPVFLMLYGRNLVNSSETCADTNPNLYKFCNFYSMFNLVLYMVLMIVGTAAISIFFWAVSRGYLNGQQPASQEAFDALPLVPYDEELFAEGSNFGTTCCICLGEFGKGEPIKQTPCNHVMHAECLQNWLQTARSCPMCRLDIEEAHREAPV